MRVDRSVFACDFCGKDEHELKELVRGPCDVCICEECAKLCVQIMTLAKPPVGNEPGSEG